MNEKQSLNQVKLNSNIEIIYKNLWAVNFDYLSNSWLQGITIDNLDIESYLTIVEFRTNNNDLDGIINYLIEGLETAERV